MSVGKTLFVTGCSSGIGYHTAVFLKQRGHRVICSARKPDDVERLRSEGFECLQLDLADSLSIQQAVRELIALTDGKIDALFNNGAFGQPGAVEDLSRDVLRDQFETNLFGTHELTNLLLPVMRKQGHGRVIYNSSVLGIVAMKFRGAYNASKFALEGLADTLRLELRGTGIHIVLIEPGPIESRFRQNAFVLYQQHIDAEHSFHKDTYKAMEARLQKPGPAAPFTLPASAVAEKVAHALESNRPKIRYRVTVPTHLFAWLKRLLPSAWLDKLLVSVE
ncbi:SDR family oxidoreductase [Methylomonas methanica]|uniref:Short-chain dehydrogenase/reductase n=1 Tax=Methylomonas methanica TaxID=421 RepID=A0A177MB28_METMH|nr:SDR family oxidoreductase [Methylomonas methanica]OAI02744.1 short-chain dehydrogenase/reductase [Methylomonas methanica]OAI07327.1 short-chain dehydrogenase/reductase [Methylomonas methanica]